jgi:uncharacterized membrane protein YjfL (UPF0719 family)
MVVGSLVFAQTQPVWADPYTFGMSIFSTIVFGLVGIGLAIFGFKLFDWLTPGELDVEIIQKQNLAASLLGAAIILGICIIVAQAIR